jgi:predicted phosphodiesterase
VSGPGVSRVGTFVFEASFLRAVCMIVGFLADIHEDIVHLDLALEVLARHRCEKIVCLGDIVGFTLPFYRHIRTRDAEACVSRIRDRCSAAVAGNHDLYAVRKVPEYKSGFDYGPDWYGLDYEVRAKKARNRIWLYEDNEIPAGLSPASRGYLGGLRETERLSFDGLSCLVSHFCSPDFSGSSVFSPRHAFHLKKHFEFMDGLGVRIGFSGHGHPDGCLIADEENITLHDFGTIPLADERQWIVAPCVAHTTRANGCMVLDTEKALLEVIPLKASPIDPA